MTFEKLKPLEKITRAKIQLGYTHPFWSYLVLHGKYSEDNDIPTIGVDQNGNVRFNKKFINSLSESEIEGVIAHEIFHVAFEHLNRLKTMPKGNAMAWNVAADIVTNNELVKDGLDIPRVGIIPHRDEVTLENGYTVSDISKKTVEKIYGEIANEDVSQDERMDSHTFDPNSEKNENKEDKGSGGNGESGDNQTKDSNDGSGQSKKQETSETNDTAQTTTSGDEDFGKKNWTEILVEAATFAKQRGTLPSGIERRLNKLLNPEIDWKNKLYKYVTDEIPYDYTYAKPSKKSIASGFYMPSSIKEKLSVVVGVDVSGSVSQKEFTKYMTEVVSLAKTFAQVDMTLLTWDTQVREVYKVENGNIDKIQNLKMSGGGGTNINAYFRKVKELGDPRLLITLTDGYFGRIEEELNAKKIWVLTSRRSTKHYIKDGEVIEMEDSDE